MDRTEAVESVWASLADASVVPVTPKQLLQLQDLIHTYTDQIPWSCNDIGCLVGTYTDFYRTIPAELGASRCHTGSLSRSKKPFSNSLPFS